MADLFEFNLFSALNNKLFLSLKYEWDNNEIWFKSFLFQVNHVDTANM